MEKKCKVVMLSTDKQNKLQLNIIHNHLFYSDDGANIPTQPYQHLYVLSDDTPQENDYVVLNTFLCPDKKWIAKKNKDIKNDRWIYSEIGEKHGEGLTPVKNGYIESKMIASTNRSLGLPHIPFEFAQKFISSYNDRKPITEVMVEYHYNSGWSKQLVEEQHEPVELHISPKTDNNCIIILPIKQMFSREELPIDVMLNLIGYIDTPVGRRLYHSDVIDQIKILKSWIEENINLHVKSTYTFEEVVKLCENAYDSGRYSVIEKDIEQTFDYWKEKNL